MSDIPTDMWREILVRLEVEELLQLRCVCSSFKEIIDSPVFRGQHLSFRPPSPRKLILCSRIFSYKLDLGSIDPSINMGFIPTTVVKITNPFTSRHVLRCSPHSSCGVLLMQDEKNSKVYAWNPSTNGVQRLPHDTLPAYELYGENYGVGFDELTNDSKVVLIRHHCHSHHVRAFKAPYVLVYKLKTNHGAAYRFNQTYWKEMEPLMYDITDKNSFGVFVSGALHWLVRGQTRSNRGRFGNIVLAIDLVTEKYRLVPFPRMYRANYGTLELCVLGGCLCVNLWDYNSNKFELWSMKEYGVVDSWSKVYAVNALEFGFPAWWDVLPVAYSNCRTLVLLLVDTCLIWYHLQKKSIKLIKLRGCGNNVKSFTATAYAGSFVPVGSDTLELEIPFARQRN